MDIAFGEHLDLLDLHGRAAVASLGQLQPTDTLPPHGTPVHTAAREHWATLEVWAWSLEHPGQHWSERADPAAPPDHAGMLAAVTAELARLEGLLLAAGPDQPLDYFGHPGTTGDVARLLAHEAIGVAHAASLAAGRATPVLQPTVASDGIARALDHWAEPDAGVAWHPRPALVRAADTGHTWWVAFGEDRRGGSGAIRAGTQGDPAVVVEGPASTLLWWLHDHKDAVGVVVTGDPDAARVLRLALGHELEPARRRRGWWRG